jgi:hypothetical protein
MPVKAPKGASGAAANKAAKINATDKKMQKSRRSHDPNRALKSLPISVAIENKYDIADNQIMSKGLLIVLASMGGLTPDTLPDQKDIRTFDDFVNWVRRLTFDNGFLIINLTGRTGAGKCISRGSQMGKSIHVTSGGLAYTDRRGTHAFLCGTTSHNAAHIFADLSDPFVKTIVPALVRLDTIKIDEDKGGHDDDAIFFADDITEDISYPLLLDTAKIINPKLIHKRIPVKKICDRKNRDTIAKKNVKIQNDYMAGMNLPSSDEEDEEEDGTGTAKPAGKVKNSKTIQLNQQIDLSHNFEDDEEDEYVNDTDDEDDGFSFEK